MDCRENTESMMYKFRTVISMLNRSGHTRFCSAPVQQGVTQTPPPPRTLNLLSGSQETAAADPGVATIGGFVKGSDMVMMDKEWFRLSNSGNSSSTLLSSIIGEGSVSNGKCGTTSKLLDSSMLVVLVGESPVSKKRCREDNHNHSHSGKTFGSSLCHCKKRKSQVNRTIKVHAISSKIADIPPDEFSWRKYGQKPINGSPYPWGYYKCSTVRGCPARKHVERADDDLTVLIVTYSEEHLHTAKVNAAPGVDTSQLTVVESAT